MMDPLETGFVAKHGSKGWDDPHFKMEDYIVHDLIKDKDIKMEATKYLPILLPVLEYHLKEKGCLKETVFHIADEPSNNNAISWRKILAFVHKYALHFRRIDAIEGTYFDNRLEVWIPKLNQLNEWLELFRKGRGNGNELWYYMAMANNAYPNRFIDPPLIEIRILRWLNYRFDIVGYLHYGLNWWKSDDPYSQLCAAKYGIGANAVVYPKRDGIINSIRWEEVRNGLSDYEYFWLSEQEIRRLKKRVGTAGFWNNTKQRGVEIATEVMCPMTNFTRNSSVFYRAKEEIINEILNLQKSLLLYVQTNPLANSQIVYGPILLEITGWTEPRTRIMINDENVFISSQGFFRKSIPISPKQNKIVVLA